jgi:hypothetical protein
VVGEVPRHQATEQNLVAHAAGTMG